MRSPLPKRKEQQRKMSDELTTTPIPCPPVPLWGGGREEVENLGLKLTPERRKEWGEIGFKICFYFTLSYSE